MVRPDFGCSRGRERRAHRGSGQRARVTDASAGRSRLGGPSRRRLSGRRPVTHPRALSRTSLPAPPAPWCLSPSPHPRIPNPRLPSRRSPSYLWPLPLGRFPPWGRGCGRPEVRRWRAGSAATCPLAAPPEPISDSATAVEERRLGGRWAPMGLGVAVKGPRPAGEDGRGAKPLPAREAPLPRGTGSGQAPQRPGRPAGTSSPKPAAGPA